eukprot:2043233-Lingulodinium_polyedra.AAC.1
MYFQPLSDCQPVAPVFAPGQCRFDRSHAVPQAILPAVLVCPVCDAEFGGFEQYCLHSRAI